MCLLIDEVNVDRHVVCANWPLHLDSDKRVKNGLDSLHVMGAAAADRDLFPASIAVSASLSQCSRLQIRS